MPLTKGNHEGPPPFLLDLPDQIGGVKVNRLLFWFFCDIVYFDISFTICDILFARGSAPEPGVWNFGNLTGESNYVGVVKNAYKGSRLDIRLREYILTS